MRVSDAVERALERVWGGAAARSVESVRLDFKQDALTEKESLRIATDAGLCLANTDGGAVVLGVADDPGGVQAFLGSTLDPLAVRKYVADNTRPQLLVEAVSGPSAVTGSWSSPSRPTRSQGETPPAGVRRTLSGDVELLRRTLAAAIETLDELGDPEAVDASLRSAEARAAASVAQAQVAAELAGVEVVAARAERDEARATAEVAVGERALAVAERDAAVEQLDRARAEVQAAEAAASTAEVEALSERERAETLMAEVAQLREQQSAAQATTRVVMAERDAARGERDAALAQAADAAAARDEAGHVARAARADADSAARRADAAQDEAREARAAADQARAERAEAQTRAGIADAERDAARALLEQVSAQLQVEQTRAAAAQAQIAELVTAVGGRRRRTTE